VGEPLTPRRCPLVHDNRWERNYSERTSVKVWNWSEAMKLCPYKFNKTRLMGMTGVIYANL
jgi:hypothetical protein